MAIPLAPAEVAVISIVGVGIFKVVKGDHDRAFFLILSSPTPLEDAWSDRPHADSGGMMLLITVSAVEAVLSSSRQSRRPRNLPLAPADLAARVTSCIGSLHFASLTHTSR
jgi:hypothetical protein